MTNDEYQALPQEQRSAMIHLHNRYRESISWDEFVRKSDAPTRVTPYVGVYIGGMFHGIEPDGYTHT